MSKCALILSVLLTVSQAFSHGSIHDQVDETTQKIQKNPKDAQLYIHRGELHIEHQEYRKAEGDFNKAAELNPNLPEVDLARARMYLAMEKYQDVVKAIDRHLAAAKEPTAAAHVVRARAYQQLKSYELAAEDYKKSSELSREPDVALYFDRATCLRAAQKHQDAIKVLEEGLAKLPGSETLDFLAFDIEEESKQYDAALRRLDRIMKNAPRKENWLYRQGQVYQKKGDAKKAQQSFKNALGALENLPQRVRRAPATLTLEKEIRAAIGSPE